MMNLKNHFLIAMPNMKDPTFEQSVVYICEHDNDGAMGIKINHPRHLTLESMLEQVDLDISSKSIDPSVLSQPVLNGGPITEERGFVLHSKKEAYATSIPVTDDLILTTSKDILTALGTEQQPEKFIVTLGYSGWNNDQIFKELVDNSWLVVEADPEIIFHTPISERWRKAIKKLGVNPENLSMESGRA